MRHLAFQVDSYQLGITLSSLHRRYTFDRPIGTFIYNTAVTVVGKE